MIVKGVLGDFHRGQNLLCPLGAPPPKSDPAQAEGARDVGERLDTRLETSAMQIRARSVEGAGVIAMGVRALRAVLAPDDPALAHDLLLECGEPRQSHGANPYVRSDRAVGVGRVSIIAAPDVIRDLAVMLGID